MYDIFVIANYEDEQLRERLKPLSKYVRVTIICAPEAIWPEQWFDEVMRCGVLPRTDYFFVVPAYLRFIDGPLDWMDIDILERAIYTWSYRVGDQVISRPGLTLFPSNLTDLSECDWIARDEIITETDPYPVFEMPRNPGSLEWIRTLIGKVQHPFLNVIPHRMTNRPSIYPFLPLEIRDDMYKIYTREYPRGSGIDGQPVQEEIGAALIPYLALFSPLRMDKVIYGLDPGYERVEESPYPVYVDFDGSDSYDIFFLSNGETNADRNWELLKSRYPWAKRIDGVKGVLNAHVEAAWQAESPYFWVVDADNILKPNANLLPIRLSPFSPPITLVYQAQNNVNDLEYGNGGIKLFPTNIVRNFRGASIRRSSSSGVGDFTGMISQAAPMKPMGLCWSITEIDSTPLEAYRAGFRESVKLVWSLRHSTNKYDSNYLNARNRFERWALATPSGHGRYTVRGVYDGHMAARSDVSERELSEWINDYPRIARCFEENEQRRSEDWWNDNLPPWREGIRNASDY